jgi:hypothetical protein
LSQTRQTSIGADFGFGGREKSRTWGC